MILAALVISTHQRRQEQPVSVTAAACGDALSLLLPSPVRELM